MVSTGDSNLAHHLKNILFTHYRARSNRHNLFSASPSHILLVNISLGAWQCDAAVVNRRIFSACRKVPSATRGRGAGKGGVSARCALIKTLPYTNILVNWLRNNYKYGLQVVKATHYPDDTQNSLNLLTFLKWKDGTINAVCFKGHLTEETLDYFAPFHFLGESSECFFPICRLVKNRKSDKRGNNRSQLRWVTWGLFARFFDVIMVGKK